MSLAAKDLKSLNIITAIPSDKILMLWEEVSPMLAPAVERSHGRWTMEFLLDALRSGQQHLWIVFEGNG